VGQIDDIHQAEDQRQPGGHGKEQHAKYQSIEELDEEVVHVILDFGF
jgi:hypothetical protein